MTTTARRAAAATGAVGGSTVAGRLNPVAKLAAIGVVTVPLLVSRDVVTSGVLVGAEVIALPLLGLGGRLLGRAWPLALGLATLWLANYLGRGSVSGMVGISLRLVALGLPGLLLVASTDPTDLADALIHRAFGPDSASVTMDNTLNGSQADTRAFKLFSPVKTLKYAK